MPTVLLNTAAYFAVPFTWVMMCTDNRVAWKYKWAQVDRAGVRYALLLLVLFQLVWTPISGIHLAPNGSDEVFNFNVYKPIVALLGITLGWFVTSIYDLPGIPSLYDAAMKQPLRAGHRNLGLWWATFMEYPGWFTLAFLELLGHTAAPLLFFIGNPENSTHSSGAAAGGIWAYAGAVLIGNILFDVIYLWSGRVGERRGDKYPAGPMYGEANVYRSNVSRRYFFWILVTIVVVIFTAIFQTVSTHPVGWVPGNYDFFDWPFWHILITAGPLIFILALYTVIAHSNETLCGMRSKLYDNASEYYRGLIEETSKGA